MNIPVSSNTAKLLREKDEIFDVTSTLDYPTIADVVCWICDNHQIWITAHPEYCNGTLEWIFNFEFLNDINRTWREQEEAYKIFFEDTYKTKEEAYEVCIKHVLNSFI